MLRAVAGAGGALRALVKWLAAGLALAACASAAFAAPVQVVESNFGDGEWLSRDQPVVLRLNTAPPTQAGRLALFIGSLDVSSQLEIRGAEVSYDPKLVELRSGETLATLYWVSSDGQWEEIGSFPLRVLTRGGFQVAEIEPVADLTFDSTPVGQDHNFELDRFDGRGTFRAGVATHHVWKGLDVTGVMNTFGATRDRDALQFATKGNGAEQFDLIDYLFQARYGPAQLALGHSSYGNHPYLISLASRGLFASVDLHERVDVSATVVRGQNVVGWEDFAGLSDVHDNAIYAATLGVDVLDSDAARARLETTYAAGSQLADSSFNTGQVRDAEESRGFGMRLFGGVLSDRIRYDAMFARNTFDNNEGNDPNLTAGLDVVGVKKTTDMAWYGEVAADLLRDYEISKGRFATITIFGSHETVEPLYKTLGAFTEANLRTWQAAITSELAGVFLDYRYIDNRNNIDDLDTLPVVRRRSHLASASLPLATLFTPDDYIAWLPTLSGSYTRTHEFTSFTPDEALSGFNAGNVPDNLFTSYSAQSTWVGTDWSFQFAWIWSFSDNDQLGSEDQDTNDLSYSASFSVLPCAIATAEWCDGLSFNGGGSLLRQRIEAEGLTLRTWNAFAGFDWELIPSLILSSSFTYSRNDDSSDFNRTDVWLTDAELNYGFDVPMPAGLAPRRFNTFVKYARRDTNNHDNVNDDRFVQKVWFLTFGVSVSVF